jgi:hypothetical protein
VIVCFVDIDGIAAHHNLDFLLYNKFDDVKFAYFDCMVITLCRHIHPLKSM